MPINKSEIYVTCNFTSLTYSGGLNYFSILSSHGFVVNLPGQSCLHQLTLYLCISGKERRDITASRIIVSEVTAQRIDNLWNVTRTFNILYKENWTIATEKVMKEFQVSLLSTVRIFKVIGLA